MYDILQLNDMLVPELLDIAEQLNISNAKKSDKQDLIYKILDKQATGENNNSKQNGIEKPKRKRIVKTSTANATEEAEVMTDTADTKGISSDSNEEKEAKQKKKSGRKTKEKEQPQPLALEETPPAPLKEEITDIDIPEMGSRLLSLLGDDEPLILDDEAIDVLDSDTVTEDTSVGYKPYKREPVFNINLMA